MSHPRTRFFGLCLLAVCVLLVTQSAATQETPGAEGLAAQDVAVVSRTDAFGQEIQAAEGQLANEGETAYTSVNLAAEVYDANGDLVGEGLGYLVNACGAALVDLALRPGEARSFSIPLELYEDDVKIDRVEIIPQGAPVENETPAPSLSLNGITPVTRQEVVELEWIDESHLRFGVGCAGDVFTALAWYEYDLRTGSQIETPHPKAELVTEAMRRQTGLTDPALFNRSHLSFAPDARRMVYQNELNAMVTAEPDGSFKRVLYDDLHTHSLQGIAWLRKGVFLAYYFGASGEPVRYFTANVEGRPISGSIENVTPSVIVPGATPDGLHVVIGGTFDDQTGYFLKSTVLEGNELLFEADLPGNNWPAPVVSEQVNGDTFVYVARPVDGQARLECYESGARQLYDLTALPLQLASDERAWMWLSTDGATLALAANGVGGGLWLVNLTGFMACAPGKS